MTTLQKIEIKGVVLEVLSNFNTTFFDSPDVHKIVEQTTAKITAIVEEK